MTALALLPLLLATPTIDGAELELRRGEPAPGGRDLRAGGPRGHPHQAGRQGPVRLHRRGRGGRALASGTAELGGNILPCANYAKIQYPAGGGDALRRQGGGEGATTLHRPPAMMLPCKPQWPRPRRRRRPPSPVAAAPVKAVEPAKAEPSRSSRRQGRTPQGRAGQLSSPPRPKPGQGPRARPQGRAGEGRADQAGQHQHPRHRRRRGIEQGQPLLLAAHHDDGRVAAGGRLLRWRRKKHHRSSLIRIWRPRHWVPSGRWSSPR